MTESFNTTGPIRSEVIYVPWRLRKALGYVAGAQGTTREYLAEQILTTWMDQNHPNIGLYLDKREKEEKEFQKSISNIPFTKPNCPAETMLNAMAADAKKPLHEFGITP